MSTSIITSTIPTFNTEFFISDEITVQLFQTLYENGCISFNYIVNETKISDQYQVLINKNGKFSLLDLQSSLIYHQKILKQNDEDDDNTIASTSIQNDDNATQNTKDSTNESHSTIPLTWKDCVSKSHPNTTLNSNKKMIDKILSIKKYPTKKLEKKNLQLSTVNPSDNVQFLSFSLNKKSEDEKNNCLDELENHIKNISEKKLKNIKDGKEIFYLNTITNEFAHKLQQGNWIFFKFQYIIDELNVFINELFSGELKISAKNSDPKGSDKKIFVELYLHNKNVIIR